MESIWMGVAPRAAATRILAMHGPSETLLKAVLRGEPSHPRALGTLLEALALWQGAQVRAVLCADDQVPMCDSTLWRAAWEDGGPLYSVTWVPGVDRPRRQRAIPGVGDFRDLERVLVWEAAR
ncbi:MAG TPA: hypothetical protein VJN18_06720 [Polyangiaceae bacterium]|nr:hypothetical protein [Polyangiaceae bacterium]